MPYFYQSKFYVTHIHVSSIENVYLGIYSPDQCITIIIFDVKLNVVRVIKDLFKSLRYFVIIRLFFILYKYHLCKSL